MNDLSGIGHAYLPMAVGAVECAGASWRHSSALSVDSPARSRRRTNSVSKSWWIVLDGDQDLQPSWASLIGVCVQEERKDDGVYKRDRSLWWWFLSVLRDGYRCLNEWRVSLKLFERWKQIIIAFSPDLSQHVIIKNYTCNSWETKFHNSQNFNDLFCLPLTCIKLMFQYDFIDCRSFLMFDYKDLLQYISKY